MTLQILRKKHWMPRCRRERFRAKRSIPTPALSAAFPGRRLLKEQTRAKNKETLLEIINNANIAENQKQEAVDEMIALTDLTERETAAEILLETRGYADAVVTITDESADVVVGMSVLSDAQCAQIEDIVARKTGIAAQNIVINPLSR